MSNINKSIDLQLVDIITESPDDNIVDDLKDFFYSLLMDVIGTDDKQDWDDDQSFCNMCDFWTEDDARNCICTFNNALRAEQRQKLNQLFNKEQEDE